MSQKFLNGANLNSQKITSVLDPTSAQDAATKNYTDGIIMARCSSAVQATQGTTTSASYSATLTSGGTNPAVTVTTGTTALVHISARMNNTTNANPVYMSVAVSGATTVAAADDWCVTLENATSSADDNRWGATHLFTGLTAGSNTFTLQYKRGTGGTAGFAFRELVVQY
jgi:hypothetical protein